MADANTTVFLDLWSLARDRLDADDRQLLDHNGGTGGNGLEIVRDLQSLTDQAKQDSIKKRWRVSLPGKAGKKIIIRDLLSKTTKWLNIFVKVGDAAVQYDPVHAALPWAGVKFLLQVATNDIDTFGFVLEGIEVIARVISRSAVSEDLYLGGMYQVEDRLQECLVDLYTAILKYLTKAQRYYRQNTLKRMVKSAVVTKESFEELLGTIKSLDTALDRWSSLIHAEKQTDIARGVRELSLTSQREHQNLLELLREIEAPIGRVSQSLTAIEDALEQSKRAEILEWLSPQPYGSHHGQARSGVIPGTGDWLLKDASFILWHNESASSLFWLHGLQGTGKSKLVSIVVADAIDRFKDGLASLPAYFYCSRNPAEPERSNPTAILASIARQLACLRPGSPLFAPAVAKYEDARLTGSSGLTLEESCGLILQLVEFRDMTTIVIDALDECDAEMRSDLLEALQTILYEAEGLMKIFVSSRNEGDIKHQLQGFPNITTELDRNLDDISKFVELETDRLIRRGKLLRNSKAKDELRDLIVREVIEKADGMFRWASMQLEHLCRAVLDEDLHEMLGRLPLKLSELYSQLYENMLAEGGPASTAVIQNSLRWLLSSQQPLRSSEFRRAISSNINISLNSISNDHILDLLQNFLVLDHDLDVFRFAHLSVAEYLEGSRPEYSTNACHALAAEICLIEMIQSSRCKDVGEFFSHMGLGVRGIASKTDLHRYAVTTWAWHSQWAGEVQRTLDSRFRSLFRFFLLDDCGEESPLSTWVRSSQRPISEVDEEPNFEVLVSNHSTSSARSYFLACTNGFCEIVRMSLTDSDFIADMRSTGSLLAVRHHQEPVWRLLLNSDKTESVLMVAMVENLSLESLQWLLKLSPETEITKEVLIAATLRDDEIMKLLLEHGKDIMITQDIIELTSETGEASALKVLLGQAKNCEITEESLSRAASKGDPAVVELLLAAGGHRRITSKVLGEAARSADEDTLWLLLDLAKGVDIDEKAVEQGVDQSRLSDGRTVRILLENGGKVTQRAVLTAAERASLPVLEALFDWEGKLNQQVMRKAAANYVDGLNVFQALMERVGSTSMFPEVFTKLTVTAASNIHYGPIIMKILLHQESCKGIQIVEEVLLEVTGPSGNSILALLLEDGRDIELTEKALESLLQRLQFELDSHRTIETVLQRARAIGTTQGMLVAAARNNRHGDEMISLLLSRPNLPPLTEETIKSVVSHPTLGLDMVKLLEKHYGKVEITDGTVKECAAHGSLATMQYIIAQNKATRITPESFDCCARTGKWEVAQFILRQNKEITITQEHIDLAAGNAGVNHYMLRFLIQERPDCMITNGTLKRALLTDPNNLRYEEDTLRLMVRKGCITCLPADVWMTALNNMSFLLEIIPKVEISEELLEAAARHENVMDWNECLQPLLSRNVQIQLTERILNAAAANSSLNESTLRVLFSSRGAIENITEEVQITAALCGNLSFFKGISQVEGIAQTDVKWEEVARLRVAVRSGDHATVSELLRSISIEIDMFQLSGRALLSIAAEYGHDEVVKLLLEAKANPNLKDSMESAQEEKSWFFDRWKCIMASSKERTPLFWAVCEGHYETVEILMDAGADVNVVDSNGISPLDFVRKWQCPHMEELLRRKSSEGAAGKQGDNEGS